MWMLDNRVDMAVCTTTLTGITNERVSVIRELLWNIDQKREETQQQQNEKKQKQKNVVFLKYGSVVKYLSAQYVGLLSEGKWSSFGKSRVLWSS